MANSENNDDLINNINSSTEEQIANVLEEKQLKAKWREEISTNSAAMDYLKSKGEHIIEGFISNYVNKKYVWYINQSYKVASTIEDEWIEKCNAHLMIMLRKKIIDLQCLWNANLAQVLQVETSGDFNIAFADPFNCSFIAPLTQQEIKMYQDFLLQDGIVLKELNTDAFLFYDSLKAKHSGKDTDDDDDEDEQPKWYDYHYERTDTKDLLDLPSIRREQERFYYKLAQQKIESEKEPVAPIPPAEPSDERPFLSYYDHEVIKRFVTQFETPDYQKKHKYYMLEHKEESKLDFKTEHYFNQMIEKQEYIPMQANDDFKAAIIQSYNDYCIGKIVEALPHAHEQYLYKTKHGLHEQEEFNPFAFIMTRDKEMILNGRVLNGEPRNFDF